MVTIDSKTPISEEGHRISPYLVLFVSVLAMSWAAPLVRFTEAHPLAVSFWRLAFALPIIGVVLTVRGEWRSMMRLRPVEWLVAGAAGVFLAAHFATWIASVHFTTIAASVALVSTQPVWVAVFALVLLRERPRRSQWFGIGLAVAGAGLVGWGDWNSGGTSLFGDLLALAGALLVAVYYVIGRGLRRGLGVWPYVAIVYGAAALTLGGTLVLAGIPLVGAYATSDWLVFLALALGPMMIGHTGQNYALGFLPAYAVNLTLLGEPVGATLIGWALPGIAEVPPVTALAGGALIGLGILLGLRRN